MEMELNDVRINPMNYAVYVWYKYLSSNHIVGINAQY